MMLVGSATFTSPTAGVGESADKGNISYYQHRQRQPRYCCGVRSEAAVILDRRSNPLVNRTVSGGRPPAPVGTAV